MGNEIDYNELFGLDESGGSSELFGLEESGGSSELFGIGDSEIDDGADTKDTDNSVESDTSDDTSRNDFEPDSDYDEDAEITEDDSDENSDDTNDRKKVQSAEDNKRYAAARRKAEKERDIAIQKAKDDAKADADKYIADAVRNLGIKNPYTGKLIETKAELDEYTARMSESRKDEFKKRSGMSDEEYKRFVENLPEVAEARAEAEKARSAHIAASRERAKAAMDEEVKRISKLDSSVRTVEDITKLDNYSQIYERVKRGYSLFDAFVSVNHARISEKSAASAKQKALNSLSGKEHLGVSSERGKGAADVPRDIADAYREFNPNATDAEILKHYNKYLKGKS